MAKNTKRSSGRAWKNERASVTSKNKSRPKSNKYSRTSDSSKRPQGRQHEPILACGIHT